MCALTSMNHASCQGPRWTSWPVTSNWTVRDVSRYVSDLGYAKYVKCFTENLIAGKDLEMMDAFDLQRLGVSRMEDAMFLSAHIKKVTATTMSNPDNPDIPLNISYDSGYKSNVESDRKLKMPPLADVNNLRLPFRDHGDRIYRYKLPVQSFHDHCMVMGRVDVWKMYNSKF